MKTRFLFLISALITIFAGQTASASSVSGVTIMRMMMDEAYSGKLFLKIDPSFTRPACSTNTSWEFILDVSTPHGEKMHSILLTAYATGRSLKLWGSDSCTQVGTIEDLTRIEVY